MRTTLDRIRHAILFELIGLVLLIGGGAILTGFDVHALGAIGVVSSLVATAWNYVFNLIFDRGMLRLRGSVIKTHRIRALHALLFEAGLLVLLLPFVAWMLQVSLWQAFLFDLTIAVFYILYGYAFNWGYDRAFPPPEAKARAAQSPSNAQSA
ncbi:PACE efflux transporter [Paracoccus luteus]|uniref:PACE efflux transporter n=1 Tax=Paracoccus luteus TaxID=2508543 RepID=UPI00106FFFCA|nr:PACE efflux transporter [Paracoccus luteus]